MSCPLTLGFSVEMALGARSEAASCWPVDGGVVRPGPRRGGLCRILLTAKPLGRRGLDGAPRLQKSGQ